MNALSLFVWSLVFLPFHCLRRLCLGTGGIRRKVKKAHDQLQFSVLDYCEIHAAQNRGSVSRRKSESPAQVIAKAVDFRGSPDNRVGKSFLYSGNQRGNRVLA